jgi:hypothetical protein
MHLIFALFIKEIYAADHQEEQNLPYGASLSKMDSINRIVIAGATVMK